MFLPPEIIMSQSLVPYTEAVSWMEERVSGIVNGSAAQCIGFLEHEPVYTAGSMALPEDISNSILPVINTNRGGQWTYHGPGQRVIYVRFDLKKIHVKPDLKLFIRQLQKVVFDSIESVGLEVSVNNPNVGAWVKVGGEEFKIASIGIRVRSFVTYHGIAINFATDLSYFDSIVPCGIIGCKMSSIQELSHASHSLILKDFDDILIKKFEEVFCISFT